jgi:hypothetical protein
MGHLDRAPDNKFLKMALVSLYSKLSKYSDSLSLLISLKDQSCVKPSLPFSSSLLPQNYN